MPFNFKRLEIPDVILVEAKSFQDNRGFFLEGYKKSSFIESGINVQFVQDNYSHSTKDVLRGLHYQKNPQAQAKLMMALRGEIFDVAVDIRKNSPTYGKWTGAILSEKNHNLLFAPAGFAHGFCVISEEADVLYKVSSEYSPDHERGILWNDPDIAIKWPTDTPHVLEKDSLMPTLKNTDNNFEFEE